MSPALDAILNPKMRDALENIFDYIQVHPDAAAANSALAALLTIQNTVSTHRNKSKAKTLIDYVKFASIIAINCTLCVPAVGAAI